MLQQRIAAQLLIRTHKCPCSAAIGSGGGYALAAARALIDNPDLEAHEIAKKAMIIAADVCIYTNHNFTSEDLELEPDS